MCGWKLFHKWSRWEIKSKGRVIRKFFDFDSVNGEVGDWILQSRRCEICGLTQLSKTKAIL
jgi:hypothetical protein